MTESLPAGWYELDFCEIKVAARGRCNINVQPLATFRPAHLRVHPDSVLYFNVDRVSVRGVVLTSSPCTAQEFAGEGRLLDPRPVSGPGGLPDKGVTADISTFVTVSVFNTDYEPRVFRCFVSGPCRQETGGRPPEEGDLARRLRGSGVTMTGSLPAGWYELDFCETKVAAQGRCNINVQPLATFRPAHLRVHPDSVLYFNVDRVSVRGVVLTSSPCTAQEFAGEGRLLDPRPVSGPGGLPDKGVTADISTFVTVSVFNTDYEPRVFRCFVSGPCCGHALQVQE